ncbi:N-ethylammeline chlorohydrolase [Candidatus Endobugula sertula]|uniref:5-methylthioadenosine/S-adenosylhomocysteine deaminase n=1 Tax=Candidatus Endobugula sertula TaxID=62101 RepID=A0A1D2QM33_9GAMM|nr:N-ethylammeline chlorohydrolase [Candidatus Endobugula sertula]
MNQPHSVDLIVYAKWIIPVIPSNTVLTNYSVIINRGAIIAIKPASEASSHYTATTEKYLSNHVLMPGLVNAHGHVATSLLRGYADDLPLQSWLEDHIWPTEAQHVNDTFVKQGAELAIAEMIRTGTTCFSDMYLFPDQTATVAHHAGMRCQIAFPIVEFPSAWANDADEYISKGLALRDTYRSHDLINVVFGPHSPYTIGDATFKRIATLASEIQSPVHIHLHETADEVNTAIEKSGMRPIERLHKLGVLTSSTQCVHMTQVADEDITLLQQSGAHIIHCPESNLKLASGFCPINKLLDAGINVALGTDGAASNNNLDLFGEMHTATLLGKAIANNATTPNAHQALEMATINGAKCMGMDEYIGSLETGKIADMIAIELDPLEQAPLHDIASAIVYTHNGHRVTHSWVNGKMLMDNREILALNTGEIISNAKHWQESLSKPT